ncbi:hypothetical protein BTM29_12350 [Companilactobacillus allii]|uniref:DUF218 domain-containing protein n=2 Tax=Companilactobacillus allii TaxID=1847728 RepID=A0A1P8Q605_9LACO|nr:YdcF family protein [Companilactobacillus allii]APX73288.1 hypothetical protein BTM29_12350 [Companilactobacillus allii]
MKILLLFLIIFGILSLLQRQNIFVGIGFTLSFYLLLIGIFFRLFHKVLFHVSMRHGSYLIFFVMAFAIATAIGSIVFLIINTNVMKSREGKTFTGQLSAIFGVNLAIILVFFYMYTRFNLPGYLEMIIFSVSWIDVIFSIIFFGYAGYSFIIQMMPKLSNANYIVILGAWIKDGAVTPLLKSRIDKGIQYYHGYSDTAKFVVSGGQGFDESISEAKAMRNYLISVGIPKDKIIIEDKSTSTLENMKNSRTLILADWKTENEPRVVFSTSNYHVLRASILANKVGMEADGIGAPTSLFFLPSAMIREFLAILKYYWWITGMIIIVIPLISFFFVSH